MPAIRPCFTKRFHAKADQRLFALYLPGAELTLHASVHGADGAERQMLFEALSYKRLKHRVKIESVSGLTQHAVLIDLYAKVLADNLNALVCMGASEDTDLALGNRHCNRAYAGACLQRLLPRLVMGLECLAALLEKAFGLLSANSHKRRPGRKSTRPNRHVKPHPSMAYKG